MSASAISALDEDGNSGNDVSRGDVPPVKVEDCERIAILADATGGAQFEDGSGDKVHIARGSTSETVRISIGHF